MNEVASIIDQLRILFVQHAPDVIPTGAISVALICLVLGLGLSVVGAKFARFSLTTAFVLMGALLGNQFARSFMFSPAICIPLGALMAGIIGFQTFRVWVGVAAAAILSILVLGGFGYNRVVPHLAEFNKTSPLAVSEQTEGPEVFSIPTSDQQTAYVERTPRTWFSSFWGYLTDQDPSVARKTQALAVLAAVGGLCLGLLACRPTLIISTSFMGTALVAMGLATFLTSSVPDTYQAIQSNPRVIGIALAVFFATSLFLQTLLMRKSTVGGPKPAKS